MAKYIDGFLIPVPNDGLDAYRKISRKAGKVWMEYGALSYMETVGDDLETKGMASFPKTLKVKPGEVPVFSWIVYKSKADRDRINRLVMKDPRIAAIDPKSMPFNPKRMVYGGFKSIVDM